MRTALATNVHAEAIAQSQIVAVVAHAASKRGAGRPFFILQLI